MEWFFQLSDGVSMRQAGTLDRSHSLTFRSHFFDLHYPYAMGLKGQLAEHMQEEILAWCHFAYDMAVGTIHPGSTLLALRSTYAFARQFAGTGPLFWTVRKLFTSVGEKKFNEVLPNIS